MIPKEKGSNIWWRMSFSIEFAFMELYLWIVNEAMCPLSTRSTYYIKLSHWSGLIELTFSRQVFVRLRYMTFSGQFRYWWRWRLPQWTGFPKRRYRWTWRLWKRSLIDSTSKGILVYQKYFAARPLHHSYNVAQQSGNYWRFTFCETYKSSAQRVGFFNIGSGQVRYWTKYRVAGRVRVG